VLAPRAKLQVMLQGIPCFWVLVLGVLVLGVLIPDVLVPGLLAPVLLLLVYSFLAFFAPGVLSSFLE